MPHALVTVDNGLGLRLLGVLSSGSSANQVLSPASIALVLQNGAEAAAQTAMAQILQLGSLTADDVNSDNAALQASRDWDQPLAATSRE